MWLHLRKSLSWSFKVLEKNYQWVYHYYDHYPNLILYLRVLGFIDMIAKMLPWRRHHLLKCTVNFFVIWSGWCWWNNTFMRTASGAFKIPGSSAILAWTGLCAWFCWLFWNPIIPTLNSPYQKQTFWFLPIAVIFMWTTSSGTMRVLVLKIHSSSLCAVFPVKLSAVLPMR